MLDSTKTEYVPVCSHGHLFPALSRFDLRGFDKGHENIEGGLNCGPFRYYKRQVVTTYVEVDVNGNKIKNVDGE